ncbi:RnfABCDGE type electron transport complex subunit G [Dysosmobacter sp.]|uniref:RnfABCDGE type electron transport complex subunit G n=1 Tax=Dysosmobacter sp. TaxID=2591382 RepID=UPI002A8BC63B|nr:RnfABCDGE type electron transport complex subunit G [Dysosmobacter sp.]MDY3985247.1 RnfABCDGE type electron transport complex subunit G [Dysosmobacter sp.]
MSNEVKTKEKVDMDPKYIIKLTVTLFVTCVVVAGLLGLVNSVTAGRIEQINIENTNKALTAVFEGASAPEFPEMEIADDLKAAAASAGATLQNVYEAKDGGETIGHALKIVASGSQGNIEMIVGVDGEGAVTGVSIVKNSETAGIGSKVMENENGVLDQFIGKSAADSPLTVGKNVDAISGATVSSRGVTTGVNAALAVAGVMG